MVDSTAAENSTTNTVFSDITAISKSKESFGFFSQHSPDLKIINTISELLKDICQENNSIEVNNDNIAINKRIKIFILKKIPSISIKDYLIRLSKYSKISCSTLILILVYIDRLCKMYNFKINYFNIYKFILSSMIIAIKYNEDEFYSCEFYAKLGGISKLEMNTLEYEFISLLNFNLFVKEELYLKYYELLLNNENDDSVEDKKEKEEGEEEEEEEEEGKE